MNPYAAPQTKQQPDTLFTPPKLGPGIRPVIRGATFCYYGLMVMVAFFIAGLTLGNFFFGILGLLLNIIQPFAIVIAGGLHLYGLSLMWQVPDSAGARGFITIALGLFGLTFLLGVLNVIMYFGKFNEELRTLLTIGDTLIIAISYAALLCGILRIGESVIVPKICHWALWSLLSLGYVALVDSIVFFPTLKEKLFQSLDQQALMLLFYLVAATCFLALMMSLAFYAAALRALMGLTETMEAMSSTLPEHLESKFGGFPPEKPPAEESSISASKFDYLKK